METKNLKYEEFETISCQFDNLNNKLQLCPLFGNRQEVDTDNTKKNTLHLKSRYTLGSFYKKIYFVRVTEFNENKVH